MQQWLFVSAGSRARAPCSSSCPGCSHCPGAARSRGVPKPPEPAAVSKAGPAAPPENRGWGSRDRAPFRCPFRCPFPGAVCSARPQELWVWLGFLDRVPLTALPRSVSGKQTLWPFLSPAPTDSFSPSHRYRPLHSLRISQPPDTWALCVHTRVCAVTVSTGTGGKCR